MLILKKLKISNFAIIDNVEVDFTKGFNVITGETGAGKSIIINALNLALGYKADISKIRVGTTDSEIEAFFLITGKVPEKLQTLLQDNDIEPKPDYLIFRRKLYDTGRSSAWINDKPCPINLLKTAGTYIVDMHGQHAHQQLLNPDTHIEYLDNFGDYHGLLQQVENFWTRLINLSEKLENLEERRKLNQEKRELWQFQYDEIAKINPRPGEIEELDKEQNLLENAERYHQLANSVVEFVYEGDDTLYNHLQEVIGQVRELNRINPEFDEYLKSLEQSQFLFQELAGDIARTANDIEYDSKRLEEINNRLFDLNKLQKKYNPDLQEILYYQKELDEKLNLDGSLDIDIKKLRKELAEIRQEYIDSCVKLSEARKNTAVGFREKIVDNLLKLGFKDSDFSVEFFRSESPKGQVEIDNQRFLSDKTGFDKVEFFIRTNVGEPMAPLADTVSGGEVSRIMLAMKSILASGDKIPVLIFDEIDTGISGHIARIVGEEMLNLSQNHQILCITHLPQIASLGNYHIAVKKKIADHRSLTYIEQLAADQRVEEIAKLIAGKEITESGLSQARELIGL